MKILQILQEIKKEHPQVNKMYLNDNGVQIFFKPEENKITAALFNNVIDDYEYIRNVDVDNFTNVQYAVEYIKVLV